MAESPSYKPQRKVAVGGAVGGAVTIGMWVAGLFGLEIPAEVAGSLITVASFVAAYLVPNAE